MTQHQVHIAEQVTLLDSLRKRCHFVEKAIQDVGLQNTKVVWARAEEAGQSQQHREVRFCLLLNSRPSCKLSNIGICPKCCDATSLLLSIRQAQLCLAGMLSSSLCGANFKCICSVAYTKGLKHQSLHVAKIAGHVKTMTMWSWSCIHTHIQSPSAAWHKVYVM